MIGQLRKVYKSGVRADGWACGQCPAPPNIIDGPHQNSPRWLFAAHVLHTVMRHRRLPHIWEAFKTPRGVYHWYWG